MCTGGGHSESSRAPRALVAPTAEGSWRSRPWPGPPAVCEDRARSRISSCSVGFPLSRVRIDVKRQRPESCSCAAGAVTETLATGRASSSSETWRAGVTAADAAAVYGYLSRPWHCCSHRCSARRTVSRSSRLSADSDPREQRTPNQRSETTSGMRRNLMDVGEPCPMLGDQLCQIPL